MTLRDIKSTIACTTSSQEKELLVSCQKANSYDFSQGKVDKVIVGTTGIATTIGFSLLDFLGRMAPRLVKYRGEEFFHAMPD